MRYRYSVIVIAIASVCIIIAYNLRSIYYQPTFLINTHSKRIYITPQTTFNDLCKDFYNNGFVSSISGISGFKILWRVKHGKIRQGSYMIKTNSTNIDVISKLSRGNQDPISVRIPQLDTKEQFAEYMSQQLMLSKQDLLKTLNNDEFLKTLNTDSKHVMNKLISNTYEYYWNISPRQLIKKLIEEYNVFWNEKKLRLASAIGMTPEQVMILASIVEKEIANNDEAPIIAGVFINRLKKHMRLESDPTTLYVIRYEYNNRCPSKNYHLIKSTYNTYYIRGLPHGIITIPSITCINSVLNYAKHDYLYFVVLGNSKHHVFSRTYDQHIKYVREYKKMKRNYK